MIIQHPVTGDSIANRTTSAIPVSIGTSLSLESLFIGQQPPYDPSRPIPNKVDVSKYQEIWINIHTLFRNLSSSVSKEVFFSATENELKDALMMEMDVIDSLFATEGNGFCKPVYYFCSYDELYSKDTSKIIKLRQDTTDMQKFVKFKFINTIKLLLRDDERLLKLNTTIRPNSRINALMMTHIPYDLINHINFNSLSLLESHTGILKPRNKWYTKYYPVGDKDLSHLPFNRKLLLLFGDKVLIQPNDIRLRRQIVDISIKRNWTSMTTLEKINIDFELEIKEPYVLQLLKQL